MDIVAGSALAVAGLSAIGLVATWRREGKKQADRDQNLSKERAERDKEIKLNQEGILKRLDSKDTGLIAINQKLHIFEVNCSSISSSLKEQTTDHERRIDRIERHENGTKGG